MTGPDPAELRQMLVTHLTADPRHSWTCTSERLIVRRQGRTLCKLGLEGDHLLIDLIPAPEFAEDPLLSDDAPPDARDSCWRRARVKSSEELRRVCEWLDR